VGLAVWAVGIEPGWVVTRETRLPIARWPADLEPLRIVALADLHTGAPHITVDKVREIVASVNAARPDLIVLLGDYVIHGVVGGRFVDVERTAAVLRDLQAPLGGQVNLPVLGRLIVPSRFGDRYAIGHVHEDGRDLFVSPGIGTSIIPVRFRVPPEISVLAVGS
jgi:predicted MPP superfamily phosphohydrolase